MKRATGITLIALVITIIVMLILAGVSVEVTLQGGLFRNAKNVADRTGKAVDSEYLYALAIECMQENGTIDFNELDSKVFSIRI